MLTKTQIATATNAELEELAGRISAELDDRERRQLPEPPPSRRTVGEARHTAAGSYQWEMVRCGKERCKKCAEGKGHGPYLYRYFRRGGRMVSEYVKLSDLGKHPGAPHRPEPVGAEVDRG